MVKVIKIETSRDSYDVRESMEKSMTIEELIDELRCYPMDAKVVFSNDNGYTYGIIESDSIHSSNVKTYEEEREEEEQEMREEEEWNNMYDIVENDLCEDLDFDSIDKSIFTDRLIEYMHEQGLTLEEIKAKCIEDSVAMFDIVNA